MPLASGLSVKVVSSRYAAQVFQPHIEKYVKPSAQAVQVTLTSYLGGVLAFEVAGPGEAPGLEVASRLLVTSARPLSSLNPSRPRGR